MLVLYHHPCADGAFAALAAKLSSHSSDDMIFIPHSTTIKLNLDDLPKAHTMYLLDYCGPPGFIKDACQKYQSVVLIDHHKTAIEEIERLYTPSEDRQGKYNDTIPSNLTVRLDITSSGCVGALNYFEPYLKDNEKQLFKYVEDDDLWLHKLPNSKLFTAGLSSLGLSYDFNKEPELFDIMSHLNIDLLIYLGKKELKKQHEYNEKALNSSFTITLGSLECCVYEATQFTSGVSTLGNLLANKSLSKVGIVVHPIDDGTRIKMYIRSIGSVDTTQIAKMYGGGGHLNASGCVMSLTEWNQIKHCKLYNTQ